jgi:UDP-N-acetylglucosamine pyrophosphorylase
LEGKQSIEKSNNKEILDKYPISIFIITSFRDNDMVYEFLEKNNFFQHANLSVCFQQDLTVIDNHGKMFLKNKTSILKCPTGTGGIFSTMQKYNLSKDFYLK